jgi:phospho-N-acetylmuramoyl-pentapeptide-transferase
MLYYLFEYLKDQFDLPGAGLFQYISFRAGMAIILSLIISMLFGGRIIRSLKRAQIGENIRELGLEGENQKAGTPTMGGLIIIMSIVIPCLLLGKLDNVYIQLMLLVTVWMGIIGFIDDYIKVFKQNKAGLHGKFKVMGQIGLGLIVALIMLLSEDVVVRIPLADAEEYGYEVVEVMVPESGGETMANVRSYLTNVPFFKGNVFDYEMLVRWFTDNPEKWVWIVFIPIVIFIVTAVSNGANLTDGLDGLATGTSAVIALTLGVFAYVSSNTVIADYLNILYLPHTEELVIFAACFLGGCIGFLWYNAYPAQVFMGDTGSLMIGGVIGSLAIILRKELLLPLLCGIFLIENLSVVLQVGYFKYTKKKYGAGRRIFRMAPLHHHYQKLGMHESKIVTRFWVAAIFLAIIAIITLKVR